MIHKLGFGPMSPEIIDTLVSYSNQGHPLMLIASRNQIDANSGYVMTTEALYERVYKTMSNYLWLCRDHCGPYFLDTEKSLDIGPAIEATKKTIAKDIEMGFNLIHIDTSRCNDVYGVAEQLIEFCLKLNPKIHFEFGTEENVGVAAGVNKYQEDVKFASQFPNMEFVVAQTGSLVMEDRQVGDFDIAIATELADFAHSKNVKLKEHNADYLTAEQIQMRKQAGVDACNIAPQLGVIQTKTILSLAQQFNVDSTEFANTVLDSKRWKKWMLNGGDQIKINSAGHYCFTSDPYKQLVEKLNVHCNTDKEIESSIVQCLDLYYNNLY